MLRLAVILAAGLFLAFLSFRLEAMPVSDCFGHQDIGAVSALDDGMDHNCADTFSHAAMPCAAAGTCPASQGAWIAGQLPVPARREGHLQMIAPAVMARLEGWTVSPPLEPPRTRG